MCMKIYYHLPLFHLDSSIPEFANFAVDRISTMTYGDTYKRQNTLRRTTCSYLTNTNAQYGIIH